MVRPHVIQVKGEFLSILIKEGAAEVNRRRTKGDILLRIWELLASSFDPRSRGERTGSAAIARRCPDIAFYSSHEPGPGLPEGRSAVVQLNPDISHRDQSATI
ncbi:MAG: hypothetical protein J0H42_31975 [Rhizobiales bacterium]|nr:hypothetical protein [Hyphomicrobiales bacterium]